MDDHPAAMRDGFTARLAGLAAGEEALRRSQRRLNLLAGAGRLLGSAARGSEFIVRLPAKARRASDR
jgi:hypothetical protein